MLIGSYPAFFADHISQYGPIKFFLANNHLSGATLTVCFGK